ncbi:hypothetical protein OSB04_022770 [Centaurea solstitialis]|uniref:Uncharacterized protein n=1 Tax=Centaurea solstitialis TaxID=347529 RepID=A0AA38SQD5_9ASTR|nr:hypothetical protein OSB04_022770 [Centaurea solstitialis]
MSRSVGLSKSGNILGEAVDGIPHATQVRFQGESIKGMRSTQFLGLKETTIIFQPPPLFPTTKMASSAVLRLFLLLLTLSSATPAPPPPPPLRHPKLQRRPHQIHPLL